MTGPRPNDVLFAVRGLSKAYGGKVVLRDVSFDIARGECFVVMGRSGTGKSVLLRHLNGLERPDAGTVTFDGVELTTLGEAALARIRVRLAMLFQGGALFDSMTVFDNLAFPLREHRRLSEDEIADRVRRELASVGLAGIEGRMPADLSGGMKKRVALARSLVLEPEVLLFDEPTTGLDPVTSASIGRLIRDTQKSRGMTSVVVTHDIALARGVADRVALLHQGGLRFVGTWEQVDASHDELLRGFVTGHEPAADEEEALVTHA